MPRYRYTGAYETPLLGLSHGVNATLLRDGHGQPDGSTVLVSLGDEVETIEPYLRADLVPVDTTAIPDGQEDQQ